MPWRDHHLEEANGHSSLERVIGRLETRIEFLCDQSIRSERLFERGEARMDRHDRQIGDLHHHVRTIHDSLSSIQVLLSRRRSTAVTLLTAFRETVSLKEMIAGGLVVALALKGIVSPGEVKALALSLLGR